MAVVDSARVIEVMRRMSDWLAGHKLVNGAYSVPVTGGSPGGSQSGRKSNLSLPLG